VVVVYSISVTSFETSLELLISYSFSFYSVTLIELFKLNRVSLLGF